MQRRFRPLISALVLFAYAVVGVGTVHADLLCVGADGHVAFAGPAGDDWCHDKTASSESSPAPLSRIADRGASTECTDLVLPGRTALKIQEQGAETGPLLFAWIDVALLGSPATVVNCVPAVDLGASFARTLTSHRTTVLLI